MTITTEEFSASFHSLTGTTIGERRKNLFLILNSIDPNDLNVDFSLLQPKTYLEEKFKIDTLIHFRKVHNLLEVLKSEKLVLIRRVLKTPWFVEEAFQNVDSQQLVDLIFPHVSLRVKLKILTKLSKSLKSTQRADEYFEAIRNKYGLYLASKLLSSCSLQVILQCGVLYKTKLTQRQTLIIIKKYPEYAEKFLEVMKNDVNRDRNYNILLKYAAKENMPLFLKLREKYEVNCNVGRRVTEKFVRNHQDELIEKHKVFYQILHKKRLAKALGNDFQRFLQKFFPTVVEDYEHEEEAIFSIFKNLPKNKKNINLMLQNFERLYGCSLWTHPKYISMDILDLLSVSERKRILEGRSKPAQISEEDWYCYFPIEVSFPYLKKRISLTSDINGRITLVSCLVKTCKLNDDMAALAQICEYMVKRHRNDQVTVRSRFLKTIEKEFDWKAFEKPHWDSISELMQIFSLNGEHFFQAKDFIVAYIRFRLENQLPIEEQLTELVKEHYDYLNIFKDQPKFEKHCLLLTHDIAVKIHQKCDYKLNYFYNDFINALNNWNTRHSEDIISLFSYPQILKYIEGCFEKEIQIINLDKILKYYIREQPDHDETKSLLKSYLSSPTAHTNINILNYIIKYQPLTAIENMEDVAKVAMLAVDYWRCDFFFWKFTKNYTHLEIPQKIIPLCLEKHQTSVGAIIGLSYLMTVEEFLTFVAPYYPSSLKANSKTEEGRKLYETQKSICKYLLNLQPASAILPSIWKFCQGDYLKLIIRALYSSCDATSENQIMEFLIPFINSAVSVRKHAIHLSLRLLSKTDILIVLTKLIETAKNAASRTFIFKGIFNYFLKNPSDRSWELVKVQLSTLDVADREPVSILLEADKIPNQYFAQHMVFTCEFLEKFSGEYLNDLGVLLEKISPNVMHTLPVVFCENLIDKYFFKTTDCVLTYIQQAIQRFTCKFIIYCEPQLEREQRLLKYFAVVTKFASFRHDNRNMRYRSRNYVTGFLKAFCLQYIDEGCLDKQIFENFVVLWNNFVQPHQAFQEYLYLQFTLIYIEKLPLVEIGQKLSQLFESSVNIYGTIIINLFCKYLKDFFKNFLNNTEVETKRLILIESIMQSSSSVPCLLLVILLLHEDGEPKEDENRVKYTAIFECIKNNPDHTVQICFSTYLGGTTTVDFN